MKRHTFALGLGIALGFAAVPAAAQTVIVDVGVQAGPVSGRVIYGAPTVYAEPAPAAAPSRHARRLSSRPRAARGTSARQI